MVEIAQIDDIEKHGPLSARRRAVVSAPVAGHFAAMPVNDTFTAGKSKKSPAEGWK
jgi:hypothetical protein